MQIYEVKKEVKGEKTGIVMIGGAALQVRTGMLT